jgi:hypothetical protein
MSRETDSRPPYAADASTGRYVKLPLGQLVTLCTTLAIASATSVVYAKNLERAVSDLQTEVKGLRAEMVMRSPFYAWVGQFRYDVVSGVKTFPPEPRPFFESYHSQ